jgi:FOG: TPR repeat, SEL1 subfamily
MKTKPTLLLALTFLFLFSGSVYGDDYQDANDALNRGDFKTAHELWLPLAEQGNDKAQYRLGFMYYEGQGVPQDYKTAIKWYRLAAEQGNAIAQNDLGVMYQYEQGVPQDLKESLKWYRLSAEQGFAVAQHNMGMMYHYGQGVPQDNQEAVRWFRLSAEQGLAEAQYNLAWMYYSGEGIAQDYVLAHMLLNLASSQGPISRFRKNPINIRERLEEEMTPSQIEKAQEMARNWKPPSGLKLIWRQFKRQIGLD